MKKLFAFFLVCLFFSTAYAENKAYIFPATEIFKMLIGEEIPGGQYYLMPIQDILPCSAELQYTVIHDYASKQHPDESRDHTQQPLLSYPEHIDHVITLNDGDLLLLFTYPTCDVLLIPKGEDATGGLYGLSYAELLARKSQINLAIWRSSEWKEVTVPRGTWKVGEDIPAGHWTVKCHPGTWATRISWGDHLDANNEDISYWGRYSIGNTVYNPENETFDPINDFAYYSFEVNDGDYIQIDYGAAIFMPYIGKPSFEFN